MTTDLADTFSYSDLSKADRAVVEQKTAEIRDRMGRAAQNIVEIGARLIDVKERLAHGTFSAWLRAEFDWTQMTASRFIRSAEFVKSNNLLDLTIAPSALYLLSSDSTPAKVRDVFVEKAKAGETVTHKDVKAAVAESKPVHESPEVQEWLNETDPLLAKHRAKADAAPNTESNASPDDAEIDGGLVINIKENVERRAELKAARVEAVGKLPDTTEDLQSLIGQKFGCIYADPPWKYGNQATRASTDNHYPTLTVEEIAALPVNELAADDAHLHLWVTNGFLFESKAILDAWGFEFRSTFVWCKPQMGIGNYWRNSHEILLTAIRGDAKRFNDRSLMSWGTFDRGAHSAKPAKVREFIERASHGPRLELFGRQLSNGWTVWGNQIERTMFEKESA